MAGRTRCLFWFYGEQDRQFVFAFNWLEALGYVLPAGPGGLPRHLACERGASGRVVVRDMDRGVTFLLVPDSAGLEEAEVEDLPIEATADSGIPA